MRPRSSFRLLLLRLSPIALFLAAALAAPPPGARAVELTAFGDRSDFIILYSLGYYSSLHPAAGIFFFDDADLRGMRAGEAVWIVAHGSVGETGSKNSGELMTLFAAKGLPPATPNVYLFSCESGSTDWRHPESLVAQLGRSMRTTQWPNVHVIGTAGCSITDRTLGADNSERVVRPGKEDAVFKLQLALEEQLNPQNNIDYFIRRYEEQNGRPPSLRERAEYAYRDSRRVRDFFTELIRQADAANLLYPAGQGVVTYP